jgi:methyl halide transferase
MKEQLNSSNTEFDEEYWTNRYTGNTSTWDIGSASTPIKEYIDQLTDKNIAILIPGCGNGYEAAYLLSQGFTNITVIDISPIPVENMKALFKQQLGKEINVLLGDFFELNQCFDLIIEQTFFCALDPSLRKAYAQKMPTLLNEHGKLVGLYFNFSFEKNPPFGGTTEEYFSLFSQYFSQVAFAPCYNSIASREGREVFGKMIK